MKFLKDYFTFSKSEKNGIIILISIIFLLILGTRFVHLFKEEENPDFLEFEKEIEEFERSLKPIKRKVTDYTVNIPEKIPDYDNLSLFHFDPNTTTYDEWLLLGLNERQITTIQNFKSKGGKFYKKEDMKKIYGLSSLQYEALQPYIRIHSEINEADELQANLSKVDETRTNYFVEINSADPPALEKLKGIGPVFAGRIIKYRNLLGGYANKKQLLEVYGLTEETFIIIEPYIYIDTLKIKKINLNKADLDEFKNHPYLNQYQAKAIISCREIHGNFVYIEEVLTNNLIPEKVYFRIKPYLVVKK